MAHKLSTTWKNTEDESDLTDLPSEDDELDDEPEPSLAGRPELPTRQAAPVVSTSISTSSGKYTRHSTREATQKSKERSGPGASDKFPLPCLKRGCIAPMTAWALFDLIKQGKIDLNPEYQRGIVWTEAKQSSFINTLFHHFHAPQILFNVTTDDNGAELRTCIDGKQRLTSICAFFDGHISFKPYVNSADAPKGKNRNYWFKKDEASRQRTLLPSHVMDNLKNAVVNCVEYDSLSPLHEREMFQRVQHGVPLSPADRFPAINGPWADIVRDLRNRINTTEGFEGYLDWGKARGKDFLAIARIVYLAAKGTTRANEPTCARIESFLNSTEGKPSELSLPLVTTLDTFCKIARNPDLGGPLTDKLSPLEFVMAGYLIHLLRAKLPHDQLSTSISKMRKHARDGCGEDMKFKTDNFKCILAFIRDECNRLKKFNGGKQVVAAAKPFKRVESEVDRFAYKAPMDDDHVEKSKRDMRDGPTGGGNVSGKRKRTEDANELEDSDMQYLTVRKLKLKKPIQRQKPSNPKKPSSSASTLNLGPSADQSPAKTTVRRVINSQSRTCGAPAPRVTLATIPNVHPLSSASLDSPPSLVSPSQSPAPLEWQIQNTRSLTPGLPTPLSTPTTDVARAPRPTFFSDSDKRPDVRNMYSGMKFSKNNNTIAAEQQTIVTPPLNQAQHFMPPSPESEMTFQNLVKDLPTQTNVGPPIVTAARTTPPSRGSLTPTTMLTPSQVFLSRPPAARADNCNKTQDPRLLSKSKTMGNSSTASAETDHGTSGSSGNRRPSLPPQSSIQRYPTDHFSSQGFHLQPSEGQADAMAS